MTFPVPGQAEVGQGGREGRYNARKLGVIVQTFKVLHKSYIVSN